jgi:hypothetical protein
VQRHGIRRPSPQGGCVGGVWGGDGEVVFAIRKKASAACSGEQSGVTLSWMLFWAPARSEGGGYGTWGGGWRR